MPEADSDQSGAMLRVDPQRAQVLAENLGGILQRIAGANQTSRQIRLIAVSKLKPAADILALHRPPFSSASSSSPPPHLHFGENYAQELSEKAALLPSTIRWHFIGALQTNKCKGLAQGVRNLECVSSVDSEKKAAELEKGRGRCIELWEEEQQSQGSGKPNADEANGDETSQDAEANPGPLNVHVQVNTSGEDSKSGVDPSSTAALCHYILTSCPHLHLRGLMTIGAIARSQSASSSDGEAINEDFVTLREIRDRVVEEVEELKAQAQANEGEGLELSMGMSEDFEAAIRQGADEVRVGSDVFGERPARKDFKVKEEVREETK